MTVSTSGGNNGGISNGGELYYDSTTHCNPSPCGSGLQNPTTDVLVSTGLTSTALMDAKDVSTFAAGLAPTQTFTSLTGTQTITGTAGLNVIDVTGSGNSIQNVALTIDGPANAYFVFNVSGAIQTNQVMTLLGGVNASNILWNLTGTSGNVLQTSGGDALVGTFLATNGGQFNFSNLVLDGELINTDGNIQLVSGSSIGTSAPFTPPSVPEPSTLLMLGTGLLGLISVKRKLWS